MLAAFLVMFYGQAVMDNSFFMADTEQKLMWSMSNYRGLNWGMRLIAEKRHDNQSGKPQNLAQVCVSSTAACDLLFHSVIFFCWLCKILIKSFVILEYDKTSDADTHDPWPSVFPVRSSSLLSTVSATHQDSCRDYASAAEGCRWLHNRSPVVLSVLVAGAGALLCSHVVWRGHQTYTQTHTRGFRDIVEHLVPMRDFWNVKYSSSRKSTLWSPLWDLHCSRLLFIFHSNWAPLTLTYSGE